MCERFARLFGAAAGRLRPLQLPRRFRGSDRVYDLLRFYINFFQPVMKLVTKTRHGAKLHKVHDTARTPYQRLLDAGVLTQAKQQEMATICCGLNPVSLLRQINENVEVYGPWQNPLPSSLKPDLVGAR